MIIQPGRGYGFPNPLPGTIQSPVFVTIPYALRAKDRFGINSACYNTICPTGKGSIYDHRCLLQYCMPYGQRIEFLVFIPVYCSECFVTTYRLAGMALQHMWKNHVGRNII
ncbi:MAG TPA: hypothetical protein PLR88_02685 [Bacteroidales bacterium]|nr:hypothetical protein [Bacteroidales bacterium]